jgi:hypothetical protein
VISPRGEFGPQIFRAYSKPKLGFGQAGINNFVIFRVRAFRVLLLQGRKDVVSLNTDGIGQHSFIESWDLLLFDDESVVERGFHIRFIQHFQWNNDYSAVA